MKLKIDLLRHGETVLGHTLRGSIDDELTELGWQQMQHTVQRYLKNQTSVSTLAPSQWQMVFTSPLKRCAIFAEQVASNLALTSILDSNLQEMHFGAWEGLSTQYIYEIEPELLANFWQYPTRFSPPNAELIHDFELRIRQALQNIYQHMIQQQVNHVLVVTHGGVIKLLKCLALQQPLDNILQMSAELGQLHHFAFDTETMQLELLSSDSESVQ